MKPVGIAFLVLASVALLPGASFAQNKFFATPNRGIESGKGNAQINMLMDENTERAGETATNSASITALEGRMDTAETDISDLETADTAQDTRLDSLESGMADVEDHAKAPISNTCHDVNAKLRWNTTSSAWECLPEGDPTVQPFAKNTLPTCSNSQLLRSDGSGLQCVNAGSNYVITESDPKVGATTSNQLCRGTGSQVVCDQPNPTGTLASGKWCTSNGSQINCTSDAPSGGGGGGGGSSVGFFARGNAVVGSAGVEKPLKNFQYVDFNDGNGFNNSTGIFTAPVAGKYLFIVDTYCVSGCTVKLKSPLYSNNYDARHPKNTVYGPLSAVVDLAAGEQVYASYAGDPLAANSHPFNAFGGILISGGGGSSVPAPPTCTGAGFALQWDGSAWLCASGGGGSSVRFFARGNNSVGSAGQFSALKNFQYVDINEGGGFNNSTGIFTAPVAGTYFFTIDTYCPGGGCTVYLQSSSIGNLNSPEHPKRSVSGPLTAIVELGAGEKVFATYSNSLAANSYPFNSFGGFLISGSATP